jgi:hypothetical protein
MRALIIDDMLNDFVDGKLANPECPGDHRTVAAAASARALTPAQVLNPRPLYEYDNLRVEQ